MDLLGTGLRWLEVILLVEQALKVARLVLQITKVDDFRAHVFLSIHSTMSTFSLSSILIVCILKDLLQVWERFEELWILLELCLNELPIVHRFRVSLRSRREGEDLLRLNQSYLLLLNSSFENRKCQVLFAT